MSWVRHCDLSTAGMGIHVNDNLALELLSAIALRHEPHAERDSRAELAAQFIPAGARVLELGGAGALQSLIPNSCRYNAVELAGDFPTNAATDCDPIVMLGVLEMVADVESLFTHLRFC
jgi:hypothetical protein